MDLKTFFEHFDTLAEAPKGIQRLRELILDMAVRGKLVPQDPEDEPVTNLLVKISDEQKRLIKDKKIKRIKTAPIGEDAETFETLPEGWQLVRLGAISRKLGAGSTPLGGKNIYVNSGVKFLRSQNVWNDGLRLEGVAKIPLKIHHKMSATWVYPGDVLLNITGASIGRCTVVPDDFADGNVSQHVAIIRLIEKRVRHFIHICLTSSLIQERIMAVQVGISREGLSMSRLKDFLVPLPPLAEQKRIVAKVDELMGLCDALEVAQQNRNTLRQSLRASALDALMNVTSDTELETAWAFVRDHWETVSDRPEDVEGLRNSILNIAFSGQLSLSSELDESAESLIKQIESSKQALDQKTQKKTFLPLEPKDEPFTLPEKWQWVRLETDQNFV